MVFHKFTDKGKGTHVIARELREAGIRPMRVKEWSNTVILRLLRNEKYVGDLCQKKTYTPDYLSHEKQYNRGAEEKVYIRDHHPEIAIIDRDLWDRTQAELERRSPSPEAKRKHSNRYWCSGKVWCGECGGAFSSRTKKLLSGELYRAWRCWEAAKHGTQKKDPYGDPIGCTGKSINDRALRVLTAHAVGLVVKSREQIEYDLTQSVRRASQVPPGTVDKHRLEAEIEKIRKKKIKIIDLATDGMISAADMKEQNEVYTAQLKDLTGRLAEAECSNIIQLSEAKRLKDCIERIGTLLDVNPDDDGALKAILEKAVVYADGMIDIYLHQIPFGIRLWYKTSGKRE